MDHPGVERVRTRLTELGVAGEVHVLATSARTAAQAADSLGVGVGQIVNSLVFDVGGAPLLVLTSGSHRVDVEHVARRNTLGPIGRADAAFVRAHTGQAIGGVSPVGHPGPVPTLVDVALGEHDVVWAAAGHPHAVFPTTYAELLRITDGTPTTVT